MRWIGWFISLSVILGACSQQAMTFDALPTGKAERGEVIFDERIDGAPSCSSCHNISDETRVGPGLAGVATRAVMRVEGQSATEYLFTSITAPSSYLVDGFNNLMYQQYLTRLDKQDVADLIAYLMTLNE